MQHRFITLVASGAAAAAMLAGGAALATAPANAAGHLYAAAAYSGSTGDGSTTWNAASLDAAKSSALAGCRATHGATDCQILATSQDGCVAVAGSATGAAGGYGPDAASAQAAALANNGGGRILAVKCNG